MRKKSTLDLSKVGHIIRVLGAVVFAIFVIGINDAMANCGRKLQDSNRPCTSYNGNTYTDITADLSFNCIEGKCWYGNSETGQKIYRGWFLCSNCPEGYYRKNVGTSYLISLIEEICDMDDGADMNIYDCAPCPSGTYNSTYNSTATGCNKCPANATCCNGATGCKAFICDGGYKKNAAGTGCEKDCSTSKACSTDFAGYTGTYNECAQDQKKECHKSCSKTCSGNATDQCPANATCTYDTAYKTTGTQYYGGSCDAADPGKCPLKDFECNSGFHRTDNNKCDKDVTTIKCDPGQYYTGAGSSCTTCPAEASFCPGGTYTLDNGNAQGKQSCPTGYTANTNTGKKANTECQISVEGGKYIKTANSSTKTSCEAGTFKGQHTVNYGSTSSCSDCEGNTISDAGASKCADCPAGQSTTDHKACTPNAPTSCPNGQYLSNDTCNSCGTASGVYSDSSRSTAASYTSNGATAKSKSDCYLESGKTYYTDKGAFQYSGQCKAS